MPQPCAKPHTWQAWNHTQPNLCRIWLTNMIQTLGFDLQRSWRHNQPTNKCTQSFLSWYQNEVGALTKLYMRWLQFEPTYPCYCSHVHDHIWYIWVAVSNVFCVITPTWGNDPNWHILQMDWNHQLAKKRQKRQKQLHVKNRTFSFGDFLGYGFLTKNPEKLSEYEDAFSASWDDPRCIGTITSKKVPTYPWNIPQTLHRPVDAGNPSIPGVCSSNLLQFS